MNLAPQEHQKQERREKHGLELEHKRDGKCGDGSVLPIRHDVIHAGEKRGGVNGITLPPRGGVQNHAGQKKNNRVGDLSPEFRVLQADNAPGVQSHNNIGCKRQKFNKVQAACGQIGQQGQKVKIGRHVVADIHPDGLQAAVFFQSGKPSLQKLVVVTGFKGKKLPPDQQRKECNRNEKQDAFRFHKADKCFPLVHASAAFR